MWSAGKSRRPRWKVKLSAVTSGQCLEIARAQAYPWPAEFAGPMKTRLLATGAFAPGSAESTSAMLHPSLVVSPPLHDFGK
jgi:hypothetical protein